MAEPEISAIPTIRDAKLASLDHVEHAFFTRKGGVSAGLYTSLNCGFGSGDDPENITENRRRAAISLGLTEGALTTVNQVHGTEIVQVTGAWVRGEAPKADGMVCDQPGIGLGILTADCAPVLLADRDARVIGACHAGWRGAFDGVIEATLRAMEKLGANRDNIHAAIGPCIARCSYQVGAEFHQRFVAADPTTARFFTADAEEHFRFDLEAYTLWRTNEAGIAGVTATGLDTCAMEEQLFSYRRTTLAGGADYGRALSAITLRKAG
jgi:hypothetical protein